MGDRIRNMGRLGKFLSFPIHPTVRSISIFDTEFNGDVEPFLFATLGQQTGSTVLGEIAGQGGELVNSHKSFIRFITATTLR